MLMNILLQYDQIEKDYRVSHFPPKIGVKDLSPSQNDPNFTQVEPTSFLDHSCENSHSHKTTQISYKVEQVLNMVE